MAMSRDERTTCRELIEPALLAAGWTFDTQVVIGPGRVSLSGNQMYDPAQRIVADYVLRLWSMPLAVLEAKAESEDPADGMQQGSRYANRLGIRVSIATNGTSYIVTDNHTGAFQQCTTVPTPGDVLHLVGRNTIPQSWRTAFEVPWYIDQVTRKSVRPYQETAVFESLYAFAQGTKRVLLLMATGTGKTFTIFQLVWKLLQGKVLPNNRVLFLTDRNSLKGQAFRAFSGFTTDERVIIDKNVVAESKHLVGKAFFANYQNLDEELDGKKVFEHFAPDHFDLVVVDECHRSGFGDWFGVLEHFGSAFQLGLTATPRELSLDQRELTAEEKRRDTYEYFGAPVFTYTLKQAIEDGYLVPYLLEQRVTNVDDQGFTGPDGKHYRTENFEREIRMPDRTRFVAEDLYRTLRKYNVENEKTIVFCVDDTHAAFLAQELRRVAGDPDYAARITRAERNSHQLERNFADVGRAKPRVAVTVDLLTTGFDAPDVKNIVFVRSLKSAILYKQMKGRGTRLCEDVDKRYFTIFDYSGASGLEDAEFDGHPANIQKPKSKSSGSGQGAGAAGTGNGSPVSKLIGNGVEVLLSREGRFVCLADGQRIAFEDYQQRAGDFIRAIATPAELLDLWADKMARNRVRAELADRDIHVAAFRHFFELEAADDVDVLSKVGFGVPRVPMRRDRVDRLLTQDDAWLLELLAEKDISPDQWVRMPFWQASFDHYALFGIDDLEDARTYSGPLFVERFGSFASLAQRYGGPQRMRTDLQAIKQHLYAPMAV